MASSIGPDKKELQRKLDKAKWDEDDVTNAFKHSIKVKREDLTIQDADLPVCVLAGTEVDRLVLLKCKLLKGRGEKQTNTGIRYIYFGQVRDLNRLREGKLTLPLVKELELYECNIKTRDLSEESFPMLKELSMKLTDVAYDHDTELKSVYKLRFLQFGSAKLSNLGKTFGQLRDLHMENGTLAIDDSPSWMNLTKVEFVNVVMKHKGKILDDTKGKQLLKQMCPFADITLNHKIIHKSSLSTHLRDDMRKEYLKACSTGVQKVYRARIMLVGHFAAGKTSLKRTLLHQAFEDEHISTVGIETSDRIAVHVDHAATFSLKKEDSLDHKEVFKKEVARQMLSQIDDIPAGNAEQEALVEQEGQREGGLCGCACGCLKHFWNKAPAAADKGESLPSTSDHESLGSDSSQAPQEEVISQTREMELQMQDMQEEIIETTLSLRKENSGEEIKAIFSIWDFGGQHVYYTSHQSFLSRRAVYLLVMDMSKPLDAEIEERGSDKLWADTGTPRTARDFLEFWLKSVHTHLVQRRTANKEDEQESSPLCPPVIIVCTKSDRFDKGKREEEIHQFINSIKEQIEGKPYAEHVYKIMAFSNRECCESEKIELRRTIVEAARKQPYWGEERPNKWLLLADELTQEGKIRPEPTLLLTEVKGIAEKFEIPDPELMTFLNVYHNLGDLINFDGDGVRDTIILSPQWLADKFSTVITHRPHGEGTQKLTLDDDDKTMLKSGKLTPKLAKELASDVSDPDVLIQIMERFDMLIPCEANIDNNHRAKIYMVPCLLPRVRFRQKELVKALPSIHFKCVLSTQVEGSGLETKGFLPPGLFHRLMSSCCGTNKWNHWIRLIFYDYIEFDAQNFRFALQLSHNGITVSASTREASELSNLREEIEELLKGILDQVFPNLSCVTFLQTELPYAETSSNHLIQVPLNKDFGLRELCRCCDKRFELKPWERWFGLELDTRDLPSADNKLLPAPEPLGHTLLSLMPRNIMPLNVIDELHNHGFLTLEDIECIELKETYRAQSILMYEKVLDKDCAWDEDTCKRFKEAVCVGLCKPPPAQFCPFAPERQKPASEEQIGYLTKIRPRLLDDMDVDMAIEHLVQEDILDISTKEELNARKTRRGKINKLLDFMNHVHSKAHDDFIEIIKKMGPKWVVIEKL